MTATPARRSSLGVCLIPRALRALALVFLTPAFAQAQAFNIDFGGPESVPSPAYAAAGLGGVWNAVPVLPAGQRHPLVDLNGAPSIARIYQIGGSTMLVHDDAATQGDDQALLDDMYLSVNNPLDLCIWIENLTNGQYEVLIYALTPGDPSLQSRVRVDDGVPGPIMVGGAWGGQHVHGVSYGRHVVTISNGVIGLHSGLIQALVQSGINGIQVRPVGGAAVGDATAPEVPVVVSIAPNPAAGDQAIQVMLPAALERAGLEIFDVAGRVVWQSSVAGGGGHRVLWNGLGTNGVRVPAGIYFVRLTGIPASSPPAARLIRLD
jgi:hypothetical protein